MRGARVARKGVVVMRAATARGAGAAAAAAAGNRGGAEREAPGAGTASQRVWARVRVLAAAVIDAAETHAAWWPSAAILKVSATGRRMCGK
jgi:hypothetical protein